MSTEGLYPHAVSPEEPLDKAGLEGLQGRDKEACRKEPAVFKECSVKNRLRPQCSERVFKQDLCLQVESLESFVLLS